MKKLLFIILCCSAFIIPSITIADDKLRIVTTLSSYADIVKQIGGSNVEVSYVAPPKFDPHFIEPKPSDVLKLKRADLFIHSGLDLEAWRDPLLNAVAKSEMRAGGARQLDLSQRINLLEVPAGLISRAEGDIHLYGNPHYWLDPRNGLIIADEICKKLCEIDASHANDYKDSVEKFKAKLNSMILIWREDLKPHQGKKLIGFHNAWGYLMEFSGLETEMFLEPKPGIPPTPRHTDSVIIYIREKKASAIILGSYNQREAAEYVSNATNIPIVNLFQNVGEDGQASDYFSMLDYNVNSLLEGLKNE